MAVTAASASAPRLMPSFSRPTTISAAADISAADTSAPPIRLPRKASANSSLVEKFG